MKATTFDVRISKKQAEFLVKENLPSTYNFGVMCKEYGDDEDWNEMWKEDLNDDDTFDDDYQTFEIAWEYTSDEDKETILNLIKNI